MKKQTRVRTIALEKRLWSVPARGDSDRTRFLTRPGHPYCYIAIIDIVSTGESTSEWHSTSECQCLYFVL